MKKLKKVQKFMSEHKEAAFWSTHDSTTVKEGATGQDRLGGIGTNSDMVKGEPLGSGASLRAACLGWTSELYRCDACRKS